MSATPGRTLVATLDIPAVAMQQPTWLHDLQLADIASSRMSSSNVTLHGTIGWQLSAKQEVVAIWHETSQADSGVQPLTLANGIFAYSTQRAPTELTGVDVSNLRASGDNLNRKQVPDGTSWGDAALGPDQAAFPSANVPPPLVAMDRVAFTNTPHYPDEKIFLAIEVPSGDEAHCLLVAYFTGIPGYGAYDDSPGDGHYGLVLFGSGEAYLVERKQSGSWTQRKRFNRWCPTGQVAGRHVITIMSDAVFNPTTGKWAGTRILFRFTTPGNNAAEVLKAAGIHLLGGDEMEYLIPQKAVHQPPNDPVRIDVRRDIRAGFQVAKAVYQSTGVLKCRAMQAPQQLLNPEGSPVYITAYGTIPAGTSIGIALICDDTGASCAPIAGSNAGDGLTWTQWAFTPVSDSLKYHIELTLNATGDGMKSPTVKRVTLYRNRIAVETTPTQTVIPKVMALTMSGPDYDPTHETMQLTAPDPGGVLTKLDNRGSLPVSIDLYYDPNDDTKFSRLFSGRTMRAKRAQRGPKTAGGTYPVSRWGTYEAIAVGQWAKMSDRKAPGRYDFSGVEGDGNKPFRVTSVIRALMRDAGFLDSQIDVPDLPIRLFVDDKNKDALIVEPYAEIAPFIMRLCREYLGAWIIFCPNSTNGGASTDTLGCWRLKLPAKPPYNVLCNFLTGPPGVGMVTDPLTYPTVGSTMQTFIAKRKDGRTTLNTYVEPPEGNYVIVDGIKTADSDIAAATTIGGAAGICRQPAYNWYAADFGQRGIGIDYPLADPSHPDYTDGAPRVIYHSDPSLITPEAVAFVCRRIYDLACHAKYWAQFEAPYVLITDATDGLQIRPRPLRFGDVVAINGLGYFVNSVNFKLGPGGNKNGMAAYELFSIPALTSAYNGGTDGQYKGMLQKDL